MPQDFIEEDEDQPRNEGIKLFMVCIPCIILVLITLGMYGWTVNKGNIGLLEVKLDALAVDIERKNEYQSKYIDELKKLVIDQTRYHGDQLDSLEKKWNKTFKNYSNSVKQSAILDEKMNTTSKFYYNSGLILHSGVTLLLPVLLSLFYTFNSFTST